MYWLMKAQLTLFYNNIIKQLQEIRSGWRSTIRLSSRVAAGDYWVKRLDDGWNQSRQILTTEPETFQASPAAAAKHIITIIIIRIIRTVQTVKTTTR